MTARDDEEPASDNSTHGHRQDSGAGNGPGVPIDENRNTDEMSIPLGEIVAHQHGWLVLEELIAEIGLTREAVMESAQALAEDDSQEHELVDLGRKTMLVAPDRDVAEAVAELFDRHERKHRGHQARYDGRHGLGRTDGGPRR